jgi:CubicO group peptidase (beta-lactamase class C family)
MRSLLAALPAHGRLVGLGALAVVALALGCQSTPREGRRLDRSVITREQMLKGDYVTVYDAVVAMRSSWLRTRGPDSFVLPSSVWVYIDGTRAGGVEVLHNIQPTLITTVRFYDGPTATGRWGVDNGAGVIHVSTWSEGAVGIPVPDSTRQAPRPAAPSVVKP